MPAWPVFKRSFLISADFIVPVFTASRRAGRRIPAAAGDTTDKAIANMWYHMLYTRPDQFEAVQKDSELWSNVFSEMMRYDPVVHTQGRRATREVRVGGELIPWGVERMVGLKPDDSVNIQDCENGATCRTIWVLDTGVDQDHPDLNIDTARSAEFIDAFGPRGKNTKDDENGHGTHVAGTAAAKNNNIQVVGVAAGATVVSVRVLDRLGFGYNDEVLAGLNHVAADGACGRGEVINMSLSDDASATGALDIDLMVESMAMDGCLFALAAGNESRNVTNVSPAGVDHANIFTVSAIDSNDSFASFSNYGAGVDRAAPGVNVVSLKRGKGTESKNGTSMAAPHVAGLLALGGVGCVGSDGTVISGDPDGTPDPIAHLDSSC